MGWDDRKGNGDGLRGKIGGWGERKGNGDGVRGKERGKV